MNAHELFSAIERLPDRVEAREVALGPFESIDAERYVRATFAVLDGAVSGGELEAVRTQLPGEFETAFEPGDAVEEAARIGPI